MPLNLKEAEVAAYADPSQENLAVYVKLLEDELEDARDGSTILSILEDRGLSTEDPEELEAELDRLEGAIPSEQVENMRELCAEAATALATANPSLAGSLRRAAS